MHRLFNLKPFEYINHAEKCGLFRFRHLDSAADFEKASLHAVSTCQKLLDQISASDALAINRLDRLSNILCAVVDTAEVIRNVHPDKAYVLSANNVHSTLSNFMNNLNVNVDLYNALRNRLKMNIPSHQERSVGHLLKSDFEKSGILLSVNSKDKFVTLNNKINSLGQEFLYAYQDKTITIKDPFNKLSGIPHSVITQFIENDAISFPANSEVGVMLLNYCTNESIRRLVYMEMNSGSDEQVDLLERMLNARYELARLLGKNSYAEYWLDGKMVSSPENVLLFLESLKKPYYSQARKDLDLLARLKTGKRENGDIYPWDRHLYSRYIPKSNNTNADSVLAHLGNNITIGSVFEGLSKIYQTLFGIRLEPDTVNLGETWHEDVRRLNVIHETEGILGVVYCDLFERDQVSAPKFDGAAHFTVRCSRRIDLDSLDPAWTTSDDPYFYDYSDTNTIIKDSNNRKYQLPIVVLSMKLPRNDRLSMSEVETIFHEMGHALHSMLSKTDYQHIAGTRVATDFVEVPSTLMEYFAKSPLGLSYMVPDMKLNSNTLESLTRSQQTSHIDNAHQLQLSIIDQLYHGDLSASTLVPKSGLDTTNIYKQVINNSKLMTFIDGTRWQCQFTHLYSYGASYYSYIWSRILAKRIWDKLFRDNQGDIDKIRRGGDALRRELLEHGGGRDPWEGLDSIGVLLPKERERRCLENE